MNDIDKLPTIRQLGGEVFDVARYISDNTRWSATNPSIGYYPNKGTVMAIRSSNYIIDDNGIYRITEGDRYISRVYWSELDKNLKPKKLRQIDFSEIDRELPRGLEDPKVFYRDGAWHFTCVVPGIPEPGRRAARMGIARLDYKCTKVVDLEVFPGPDPATPEKNWMIPYDKNPNFDWVYGPNAIVKNHQLRSYMTDHPQTSQLRGSSNLHKLGDDSYLAVLHKKYLTREQVRNPMTFSTEEKSAMRYTHCFARYDMKGNLLQLSKPFIFHQPGIEFAAGLIMSGKNFLISFGRNDVSSHIASIPVRTVLESLQPVEY